ncbi:putative kh domain-protein [Chaetomidium leptoderma]|uniref:Kh domain-protein n=1 Tax=Chaetomidium leptoderma TaxID=669021 RepID=A0AAN6ZX54_9PEZI|nr:putative kh domain-protein [Chaetomidium leptoderma]
MDDAERRSAKRSRFDQTEPEPRRSRFDRRSRSPPARKPDAGRDRERSPLARSRDTPADSKSPPVDAAAAVAAAAARINAQLQARKGIQHVDVPPVRSSSVTSIGAAPGPGADTVNGEMYISDGDYIKDIEVNDLRNRYLITKGSTQKMIKEETGADVTTRGNYYPDKNMATPSNPPLYLHITSTTKEGLDKAVAKIEELMKQELPQLVDERRFRRRDQEQPVERDEFGRRKWPEEKIPIGLESVPGFNLRAQVVGHGGAYVKHIQQETTCRVQIKGRGSGYMEASTGRESDEDMFLHVAGPDPKMVEKGKELCEDLLRNVREQYEEFKSRPPRSYGGGGGGGGYGGGGGRGGGDSYHGYNRDSHHQNNSHSYSNSPAPGAGAGAGASASPPASANTPTSAADYAAQYAQYYGTADPYAAYGGYQAYVQMYQQWAASQAGQTGVAAGAPGASASPPPPPSEAAPPPPPSAAPPPPPSGPPGAGGYSAPSPATPFIASTCPPTMSHQRYPSHDAVKEPHSVSLKVLRLSRPSLVAQYPVQPPFSPDPTSHPPSIPASLAYSPNGTTGNNNNNNNPLSPTNPGPFVLSPILNLPPSFGSAYVGETFSCTLCANHDIPDGPPAAAAAAPAGGKTIRDVRIEAEMKTPSSATPTKLTLLPPSNNNNNNNEQTNAAAESSTPGGGTDLPPLTSLQKILSFDLKEEGNHVLAVTVSYYEASELSGRTRTFRKLYQFVCKASLIVRTKAGALLPDDDDDDVDDDDDDVGGRSAVGGERRKRRRRRRWVLEAQLENCSEEGVLLESVGLELERGLGYEDCNRWGEGGKRPVLQAGETEQVCFVVEEEEEGDVVDVEGRVVFGILKIGWRSQMGNRGFLSTGKLGTRSVKPRERG